MPDVGITITAVDKAGKVLEAIGSTGKKALEGVRAAGESGKKALAAFGAATVVLNQAMELGRKAIEFFRMAVWESITAMLEFRRETDPVVKQFQEMERDARFLRATIGNVLTPVFLGLHNAINDTANQMIEFINANKQMIATNITVFLADLARILIESVVTGLIWASRAVSGLIEVWNLLMAASSAANAVILSGIEKIVSGLAEVAEWAGKNEMAASLRETATAIGEVQEGQANAAREYIDKTEEQVSKQAEFEAALLKFKDVAVDFVGKAEVAVLDEVAKGWTNVKRNTEQATDAVMNQKAAFESLRPTVAEHYARIAELEEKNARFIDATQQASFAKQQARVQAQAQMIGAIGDAWGQVAIAALESSEAAGQAAIKAALQTAKIVILAAAAEAAAKAFAAQQFVPFVGIALGTTAAGVAFAFVEALLGKLPKAQAGGIINAGVPGVDQVQILTQRGEGVLKPGQTEMLTRLADSLEKREERIATGAGQPMTIVNRFESVVPAQSADAKRAVREVGKGIKKLESRRPFHG